MTVQTTGARPTWTLPDKIRKAREHANLSQQELADRLTVTRTSVINWERGHTKPLRFILHALAEQTGVDYDWLTGPHRGGDGGAAVGGIEGLPLLTVLDHGGYGYWGRLPRQDSNLEPAGSGIVRRASILGSRKTIFPARPAGHPARGARTAGVR